MLEVRIPSWFTPEQEVETVSHFVGRFERSHQSSTIDLVSRSADLADRYSLPRPTTITWSSIQQHRWGSCTPAHRSIRISNHIADFPPWVLDYVIVHELAHLVVPGHGPEFWALVERYPKAERARGYLLAKGEANPGTGA